MTTVVFDGKMLAADTRCSHDNHGGAACVKCGDRSDRVEDTFEKIFLYPPQSVKFQGEYVIASTGTGASSVVKALDNVVRKEFDLDTVGCLSRWLSGGDATGTLVILTEQNLFTLRLDQKKFVVVKNEGQTYCGGSGKNAAALTLKMMDGNAIEAVAAAAQVDVGTGGEIRYIIKPPVKSVAPLTIHKGQIEPVYTAMIKRIRPKSAKKRT